MSDAAQDPQEADGAQSDSGTAKSESPQNDQEQASTKSISERFPALRQLEEDTERAKLEQALAGAQTARIKTLVPSLDVEVTHDTVTASDKTTGLARVLLQSVSARAAENIAVQALDAACNLKAGSAYEFRIVSDTSFIAARDAGLLLEARREHLEKRIALYAPEPAPAPKTKPKAADKRHIGPAAALPIATAAIGASVQAVGLITKLLAGSHLISGREIPSDDLGFDLLVADSLADHTRADEQVTITAERLMPTPSAAGSIVNGVVSLASLLETRVSPKVANASRLMAEAAAAVKRHEATIVQIDAEILKLLERLPNTSKSRSMIAAEIAKLRRSREASMSDLTEQQAALAGAETEYNEGKELASDVEAFVTSALVGSPGSRPPVLEAARAETLLAPNKSEGQQAFILYVRPVAGGLDQDVRERLVRSDNIVTLTAVSVEWALLRTDGTLVASDVASFFESSRWKLDDPDSFKRHQVNSPQSQRACSPSTK